MSMNNEEKIKLADLMEEVSQKCEVSFDGHLFTKSALTSFIELRLPFLKGSDQINSAISFICGDIIDYQGTNLTVFVDGFISASKKMNGIDCREAIARTMAYLACAKIVTASPLADLSSVITRMDFTHLLYQLMDFEQYPILVDKHSKSDILIVSNINIPALNVIVKGKEPDQINEMRATKIRSFFEEVIHKRMSAKRLTIFTIQSAYETLHQAAEFFGEEMEYMISNLEKKPNLLTKSFIEQNHHCRIYIPPSEKDAKNNGIIRSEEQQEKDFIHSLANLGASSESAKKATLALINACKTSNIRPEEVFDNFTSDITRYIAYDKDKPSITQLVEFFAENARLLVILWRNKYNGI